MPQVRISCRESDWQNVLKNSLRDGDEIDLINLNPLDAKLCETLASEHGKVFDLDAKNNAGFFKKKIMKSIRENALDAVALSLQQINPFLSATLTKIIGEGTFADSLGGIGQSIYRTFTPASPIPPETAKAILEALETFGGTPTGQEARFEGMTIHGVTSFWRNFTY